MFPKNLGQESDLPGEVGFPRQEVACEGMEQQSEGM